jgi:hypothetical protein
LATTLAATASVERIALLALRARHQIDRVEKLAALLRSLGCIFALQHANQANLCHAFADDIQRLHQTGKPVALNLKLGTNGLRLGTGPENHRDRSSLAGSLVTGRFLAAGLCRIGCRLG